MALEFDIKVLGSIVCSAPIFEVLYWPNIRQPDYKMTPSFPRLKKKRLFEH